MRKLEDLRSEWEVQQTTAKAASEKRAQKNKAPEADDIIVPDDLPLEEEDTAQNATSLFDDSDDSDAEQDNATSDASPPKHEMKERKQDPVETTHKDLFGDSSDDDSDEELRPSAGSKRGSEEKEGDESGEPPSKQLRTLEDMD